MKDRSGLILADLAAKTHYSKSSWHRWLNGERLVTEPALLRLCELAGVSDAERAALLELRASAVRGGEDAAEPPAAAGEPASEQPSERPESVAKPGPESAAEPGRPLGSPAVADPVAADPVGGGPATGVAGPATDPQVRRSRRGRWWLLAAVLVGALAVAGVLAVLLRPSDPGGAAGARPPVAATSGSSPSGGPCEAAGCVGKDPQASGCGADAVTISSANVRQMTIYVRYSKRCRAAWAKITDATVGYSATVTNAAGDRQTALVHWGYDAYSPMVDASQNDSRLQVCGDQPDGSHGCGPAIMDPAVAPALPNPTPVQTPVQTPAPAQTSGGTPVPSRSPVATGASQTGAPGQ